MFVPTFRTPGCGIYQITHSASGQSYVGSSGAIYQRWCGHRSLLQRGRHTNTHLQHAWTKWGPDAFEWRVLQHVDDPALLHTYEQRWIDSIGPVYNFGPAYPVRLGLKHTEETRAKMSALSPHRKWTDEQRQHMSNVMKGRRLTEEAKAKISEVVSINHYRTNLFSIRVAIDINTNDSAVPGRYS